ncbi:MauE/DoxX family redox-associated membrane protein [Kribbella deserti]|uniref:MauE/DoxX family redox-associated membrane protein n=1 Tax=Kribbella deserti TaxID=1926257 RepID=A0ABV6QNJ1_9ACTN
MTIFSTGVGLLVAVVLGTAAVAKIREPGPFVTAVRTLVPAKAAKPVAWIVIGAESLAAIASLLPITLGFGLALAVVLFGAFAAVAVRSAKAPAPLPCACFGRVKTSLGWPHAIRNLLLTLLAASGLAAVVLGGSGAAWSQPAVMMLVAAIALVLAAIAISIDHLIALFAS